jgi:hypothetical protein
MTATPKPHLIGVGILLMLDMMVMKVLQNYTLKRLGSRFFRGLFLVWEKRLEAYRKTGMALLISMSLLP